MIESVIQFISEYRVWIMPGIGACALIAVIRLLKEIFTDAVRDIRIRD